MINNIRVAIYCSFITANISRSSMKHPCSVGASAFDAHVNICSLYEVSSNEQKADRTQTENLRKCTCCWIKGFILFRTGTKRDRPHKWWWRHTAEMLPGCHGDVTSPKNTSQMERDANAKNTTADTQSCNPEDAVDFFLSIQPPFWVNTTKIRGRLSVYHLHLT